MTYDTSAFDLAEIRKLLLAAFTAEGLRRFCLDRPTFHPVVAEFGPDYGLHDMVDRVIDYCRTRILWDELLADVQEANPRQYARFEPKLRISKPAPARPPPPRAWPSWYWIIADPLLILVVGIGARLLLWPGPAPTHEPKNTAVVVVTATLLPTPTETTEPLTPTHTLTLTPEPSYTPTNTPTATETPITPTNTPTAIPTATWTRPADGAVLVYVPAGEFLMGSVADDPDAWDSEKPQHTVYLDAFWIDRTEVSNAQYRKCVEAGACREPECWDEPNLNAPDQPVVCVNWEDAKSYAPWVSGPLPTEAEWEKAARGTDGRIFPWGGSAPDCYKANYWDCADRPLPVGSHPDGASPYGALDMAGNVWESVADWYGQDYYAGSPFRNPHGPGSGDYRVLRGGSFYGYQRGVRCASRYGSSPAYADRDVGFCVVVAPGPLASDFVNSTSWIQGRVALGILHEKGT